MMRRVMRMAFGMALAVAGAACGGGDKKAAEEPALENKPSSTTVASPPADAAPPSQVEVAMQTMARFRDEMCACTDTPCAQRVADAMTTWSQKVATEMGDTPPKLTEEENRRATELGMQMGECMQKAMGASGSP